MLAHGLTKGLLRFIPRPLMKISDAEPVIRISAIWIVFEHGVECTYGLIVLLLCMQHLPEFELCDDVLWLCIYCRLIFVERLGYSSTFFIDFPKLKMRRA